MKKIIIKWDALSDADKAFLIAWAEADTEVQPGTSIAISIILPLAVPVVTSDVRVSLYPLRFCKFVSSD